MGAFGERSLKRLTLCEPVLQRVFERVVREFDCVILVGHRGREEQDAAFAAGKSKLAWPKSKHNAWPSRAVDAAPYDSRAAGGVNWDTSLKTRAGARNLARYYLFAGAVLGIAAEMGVRLRWGGDWDGDDFVDDQDFDDLVHFELAEDPTP
jgi:peptidoglycan L-alanyl-D-glutamate endopeptidase CwlK